MAILVVGASGATGKELVKHLLDNNETVRVIVRSPERIPAYWNAHPKLEIITGSLLDFSDSQMAEHTKDCHAVASCLGHNLTWTGVYGHPRKLVTDAARRLTDAIQSHQPQQKVKYLLMNTTGNRNRGSQEKNSFGEKAVLSLLRLLLPPHVDNEAAAEYLRTNISHNHPYIEWCAIRPDTLIDKEEVSPYDIHPSPTRSPLFDAGKTSRTNVGHFMAALITDNNLWGKWKGQMPVIYNQE